MIWVVKRKDEFTTKIMKSFIRKIYIHNNKHYARYYFNKYEIKKVSYITWFLYI